MVQWLWLSAFTVVGPSSILGVGNKIPTNWEKQPKKKKKLNLQSELG